MKITNHIVYAGRSKDLQRSKQDCNEVADLLPIKIGRRQLLSMHKRLAVTYFV